MVMTIQILILPYMYSLDNGDTVTLNSYQCDDDALPGASFYYDDPVVLSEDIQEHIKQFFSNTKVVGPLSTCLPKDIIEENNFPTAFLHTWVVDNHHDALRLQSFCAENGYQVPLMITYNFVTEMYSTDDLIRESQKANHDAIERLQKINPTIANVLIDYFSVHESSKRMMHEVHIRTYVYISILELIIYHPARELDDYEDGIASM